VQRRAAGLLEQERRQRAGGLGERQHRDEQVGRLGGVERRSARCLRPERSWSRARRPPTAPPAAARRPRASRQRADHQPARALLAQQQVLEQVEPGRVGPLQVFEDEDTGAVAGEVVETRREAGPHLGLVERAARAARPAAEHLVEHVGERRGHRSGGAGRLEKIGERLQRAAGLVAARREGAPAFELQVLSELADQPAFPRARRAADHHDARRERLAGARGGSSAGRDRPPGERHRSRVPGQGEAQGLETLSRPTSRPLDTQLANVSGVSIGRGGSIPALSRAKAAPAESGRDSGSRAIRSTTRRLRRPEIDRSSVTGAGAAPSRIAVTRLPGVGAS